MFTLMPEHYFQKILQVNLKNLIRGLHTVETEGHASCLIFDVCEVKACHLTVMHFLGFLSFNSTITTVKHHKVTTATFTSYQNVCPFLAICN